MSINRQQLFSLPVQALEVVLAEFERGATQTMLGRTSSGFIAGMLDGSLPTVQIIGTVTRQALAR